MVSILRTKSSSRGKHTANHNPQKAPTAPSSTTKRKTLRLKAAERLANPLAPRKVHRPDSVVTDTFLESKRDKRLIKHSSFVSKISKPVISKAARKNARRDDRKKLQTNLESLADALPELTREEVRGGETEKDGRVRHRSLKSKPGALRKKERVVRGEMERFGMSLAQLSTVREADKSPVNAATNSTTVVPALPPTTTTTGAETTMEGVVETSQPPSAAANRFAALRGFIAATMEQNPAFANKSALGSGKGS